VVSAEQLATARGRRAVVRYDVRGLDGGGLLHVVGKTFAEPRRAQLLHEHLRLLAEGPFARGDLRVPAPVAFLPRQRMVVYRHCEGTPLDELSGEADVQDGVRRAARWLARLHRSDVSLPRSLSLRQEVHSTVSWAALIARRYPALRNQASVLGERWAAGARPPDGETPVPLHKDFHPGHVLIGRHAIVLDLDEARLGDPAFDLAHFCGYLELVEGWPHDDARAAFLEEYRRGTGWVDSGTFAAFSAYTWLKIAKQLAAGSGPRFLPRSGADAVQVERALARGLSWLNA
jgi:aminoglycoside phosphotransferase (APT) family kinase protein